MESFLFYILVLYCFYGVLAQLGARNIRIVEATGSNPVYSIWPIPKIYTGYFYMLISLPEVRYTLWSLWAPAGYADYCHPI